MLQNILQYDPQYIQYGVVLWQVYVCVYLRRIQPLLYAVNNQ